MNLQTDILTNGIRTYTSTMYVRIWRSGHIRMYSCRYTTPYVVYVHKYFHGTYIHANVHTYVMAMCIVNHGSEPCICVYVGRIWKQNGCAYIRTYAQNYRIVTKSTSIQYIATNKVVTLAQWPHQPNGHISPMATLAQWPN